MRLRRKSLLIILLTLAGLMVIFYAISDLILLNSYAVLEKQEMKKDLDRAKDALTVELNRLQATAGDYAGWDEAYSFIEDGNSRFIRKNLADSAFANLKIGLMLFVHSSGRIVYAKAVDPSAGTSIPFPESLLEQITHDSPLVRHSGTSGAVSGLLSLPQGMLLMASRPILTSEFAGPSRGALIVGRFLGEQEIRQLEKVTHLSLTMLPMEESQKRPDLQQVSELLSGGSEAEVVQPLNSEKIAGNTVLKDIHGKPSLLLRVETSRNIYREGKATIRYLVFSLIVIGMASAYVFLVLLDKLVISRLGKLTTDVGAIGKDGDFAGRLTPTGNDEIKELTCSINGMLDALHQAQGSLKRHAADADRVNKELEAFCYSVSHDLRAPLNHIKGFSDALLEDSLEYLDEEGRLYLTRISAATERMGHLIDDLLNLSRVSRNEMKHEPVNLSELACSTMEMFRETSPDRTVFFTCAADVVVTGDKTLLSLVMENLIGNAWKYTSKQETALIEVGTLTDEGKQVVFIRDNGVGFDMSYCEKIFGPFQRFHSEREFEGTGIGLATVQRIIHRHGGRVWGEGEVGAGATFYFTVSRSDHNPPPGIHPGISG